MNILKWLLRGGKKSHRPDDLDRHIFLLQNSEWFDGEWYLQHNPDVRAAGMDAAEHYLGYGALEGRAPGPRFDEDYYLSQLAEPIDQPALLHYLLHGKGAGLQPVRVWSKAPWWWQLDPPVTPEFDWKALKQGLENQPLPVVVIPVFNAADALASCLASVSLYRSGIGRIIVLDDASTDPAITDLFCQYHTDALFQFYSNKKNLGFSGTVNRGITLAGDADVIVLNADTEVTAGFAPRLRMTAYSAANIATVTPISNNAGAFSVPAVGENNLPAQFDLACFARAIAQAGVSTPLPVPTGHGFCLYIRRAAIDEVGLFDAEAFPQGYGEENDFCMRCNSHGWQHLVDARTYIFHQGSASFGDKKQALLAAGRAVIDKRYPEYTSLIQQAFGGASFQKLQKKIATLASMPAEKVQQIKPRILYVISTRSGGTPQTNQDLMQALALEVECFVLHCDNREITLQHFSEGVYTDVEKHRLSEPIQALPHQSDEYDTVVASWLVKWTIELVHVRHLAWHSIGLLSIVKALGIYLVKSFHDFYSLCPTVKLLDNNLQYCAAQCTQGDGVCVHELWPAQAFDRLKHHQIQQWQKMFSDAISHCDAFVTTHQSVKDLFLLRYPRVFAEKPFAVIPHGRDFANFGTLAVMPERDETLRILCPGTINIAKGLYLIQEAAAGNDDIEVHILGTVSHDVILPKNVIVHGQYPRDQFLNRVAKIKPHCGAILSVWPETWCHTLTEMWAAGVPVIGVDIGAVGERIAKHEAGWLLQEATVKNLQEALARVRTRDDWQHKLQAVIHWQLNHAKSETCQIMAQQYIHLYNAVLPTLNGTYHK